MTSPASRCVKINFHGSAHTHMDALGHHFIGGKMYNGFPQKDFVTVERGAERGAITTAADGVVTRGVLVDIPRLKGVDYLEPGERITVADIEAWEKMAGVKIDLRRERPLCGGGRYYGGRRTAQNLGEAQRYRI